MAGYYSVCLSFMKSWHSSLNFSIIALPIGLKEILFLKLSDSVKALYICICSIVRNPGRIPQTLHTVTIILHEKKIAFCIFITKDLYCVTAIPTITTGKCFLKLIANWDIFTNVDVMFFSESSWVKISGN